VPVSLASAAVSRLLMPFVLFQQCVQKHYLPSAFIAVCEYIVLSYCVPMGLMIVLEQYYIVSEAAIWSLCKI